jgi:hypothetical protein
MRFPFPTIVPIPPMTLFEKYCQGRKPTRKKIGKSRMFARKTCVKMNVKMIIIASGVTIDHAKPKIELRYRTLSSERVRFASSSRARQSSRARAPSRWRERERTVVTDIVES